MYSVSVPEVVLDVLWTALHPDGIAGHQALILLPHHVQRGELLVRIQVVWRGYQEMSRNTLEHIAEQVITTRRPSGHSRVAGFDPSKRSDIPHSLLRAANTIISCSQRRDISSSAASLSPQLQSTRAESRGT